MVYKPQPLVPDEQVRVARGPVDVLHERVEPQDARGESWVGGIYYRVEAQRPRQVVEREVEASARPDQVLYLRVGLRPRQLRIQSDQHDLRDVQPQDASEFA